ncbi:MAG: hypothetical protein FJW14_04880 [Acidimicrobiia bacterium]|nr:hypothetical protein [Acidimicrobiia bacterium]
MIRSTLMAFGLCVLASGASAQVPSLPEPVTGNIEVSCGQFTPPAAKLSELRAEYLNGRWDRLQALSRSLLNECTFKSPDDLPDLFPGGKLAWSRDYVLVIFGTTAANDEPTLLRYLVHDPAPQRYATTLPGVPETLIDVAPLKPAAGAARREPPPRLLQVYLSHTKGMKLLTSVAAKRTADPVVEQTPDFLKAAIDPAIIAPLLKGTLPALLSKAPGEKEPPRPVLATVSIVPVHFRRGDLTFSDVLKAPAFIDEKRQAALRASLNGVDLAVRTDGFGPTSQRLSKGLLTTATAYITPKVPAACGPLTYEATCWEKLDEELRSEAEAFCAEQAMLGKTDEERKALVEACVTGEPSIVLARYRAAVAEPTVAAIAGTSTFQNIPRQVVTFGLISAYVLGASSGKDRVKVDGGKIVADPLSRSLSMVTINFHPPFDSTWPDLTKEERARVFIGTVVSPNIGVTVGAGAGMWRNVSINLGYALLAIPTLRPDDELDEAPGSAKKPFQSGAAHVAYIGLGYKLK